METTRLGDHYPLIYAAASFSGRSLSNDGLPELPGLPPRESTSQPISEEFVAFLESDIGRSYAAQRALWESFAVRDGQKLQEAVGQLFALIEAELE